MTNVTAADESILQQSSPQGGHPKGLWVLFGTEMWERFNFYGSNLPLATNIMWIALLAIIFGNGFFKPNISSMVGSLYPKAQRSKLDSAFTIFYLGINVGATLGQFICPFFGDVKHDGVRDLSAFKWGFLAASLAMFIGTLTFLFLKNKYVRTPEGIPIGGKPKKSDIPEGESESAKITMTNIVISFLIMLVIKYGLYLLFFGTGVKWIKKLVFSFF